jgi:4-diphosphocytidyl-2-C-methyl-D-erythritol kinase
MRESAFGKVNPCLFLGPIRVDGRHELVTVIESVSLADELTLTVLDGGADQVVCPGVDGPNLVAAALAMLRERGWDGPPVRIEIVKRIPVAAGMGGGSADAAAALRLASRLEPIADLQALAAALGSDVPSQLEPGLVLGTGAGEIVEPLAPLAPHAYVVVPLPLALSTAAVYGEADRLGLGRSSGELQRLRANWRRAPWVNDLEPAARSLCPEIGPALAALKEAGAERVFVCGSGPTCAGLWQGAGAPARAAESAENIGGAIAVLPVTGIRHNPGQ